MSSRTSSLTNTLKKLHRSFYTRPTLTVAKELLGKIFARKIGRKILTGKIVEVEAYRWNDPASHSFRGITERNKVMFKEGGFLYVYFTYGMHFCANVVTHKKGIGEAVLIRAVEPISGMDAMIKNRSSVKIFDEKKMYTLTNGPAKFAQAFQLERNNNGIDLCGDTIFILNAVDISRRQIIADKRIGIKAAQEKRWRFYIKENSWISR